jgi:hypothetical protein
MARRERPDPSTAEALPDGTPSGWYADPLGEKRSRYWSFGWSASVSDQEPRPVPPPKAFVEVPKSVPGVHCVALGGHGLGVVAGEAYKLDVGQNGLMLRDPLSGASRVTLPLERVLRVDVEGPGAQTTGGGFMGGGFGIQAAAEGLLAATVLNALTTRTTVETLVYVQTTDGEAFFIHNEFEPLALRIRLSELFVRLRAARTHNSPEP